MVVSVGRVLQENLGDIQGNLLHAYHMPVARYAFYRLEDPASGRAWLGKLSDRVTSATRWSEGDKPSSTMNVALSFRGLEALGLPTATLASFPEEFRLGMAERSEILGDVGESAPECWEDALKGDGLHVLVEIHAQTTTALESHTEWLESVSQAAEGVVVEYVQDAALPKTGTEHFGFVDGISQPSVEGSALPELPGHGTPVESGKWKPLRPGEFILGYVGEDGLASETPTPAALGLNGTFVVFRKLHQRVADFRQFLRTTAQALWDTDDPEKVELLAAKLVGRWRSGCPLELSPDQDNAAIANNPQINNNFRFAQDPDGERCPIGAHIRRANPRGSLDATDTLVRRHRILRRGLPYGEWLESESDDGADRGLVFIAVGSSISRQFEFVQEEWINKGDLFFLDGEKDPFVGANDGTGKMTLPGPSVPFIFNLQRFVTVRGGEYFFMPGLEALRKLAQGKWSADS